MWKLPRDKLIPFIFAVIMTIVIASMDWQRTLAKKSGDTQGDLKEKWVIDPLYNSINYIPSSPMFLPYTRIWPSIVHSSTWNGLNYPEYITELNLVETGEASVPEVNIYLIKTLTFVNTSQHFSTSFIFSSFCFIVCMTLGFLQKDYILS